MRHFLKCLFLLVFIVLNNVSIAAVGSLSQTELYQSGNESFQPAQSPGAISGSIAGTSTTCLNENSPVITFTGSGGTAPYTFTYSINNGSDTPIKTSSGNSVTLAVPTSVSGQFIYTLKSVSDISNVPVSQSGTSTVIVNPLPVIDFTFTDNQCAATAIQFTATVTGSDPMSYSWDFGDSSTSTEKNPSHLFIVSPGSSTQTFNVNLIVTNTSTKCSTSIRKNISLFLSPDATLNGTGSGSFFNGVPVFQTCSNATSLFTFTNGSTTIASDLNYTINWGDGSPYFVSTSWATTSHTYSIGTWNLVYTIQGPNGCTIVKPYIVFVGTKPVVSLGKPADVNICNPGTLSFPIGGTRNNPPGTTYVVTFTDGSAPQAFTHPPPSVITHTFTKPSCGITSSSFPNSFSATIAAENPCGKSEAVVTQIYVSNPPVVDFSLPAAVNCINSQVCLTNTSTDGFIATAGGCLNPNTVWTITPSTGFTLASGSLGNDAGSADQANWTSGSNIICPVFSIPGTYTISLKVGNKCGSSEKIKTICVEEPVLPQFTIDTNTGCTPLDVIATNATVVTNSCTTPTLKWDITYAVGNCGTTSAYTYTNGTGASSENPSFQFTNPGTYTISLSVTNSCGTLTSAKTVIVKKTPTVTINDIPDFCGTAVITPTALVNGCSPTINYNWSFPGGTPSTANTEVPGTITYSAPGNYEISLTLFNDCGGSVIATQSFIVDSVPVITNSSLVQTICSGQQTEAVTLTSDVTGATFSWTATATAGITGFSPTGNSNTIPVQTITTSGDVTGTVTYAITPKFGNCPGTVTNYVVTVNPIAILTGQPVSSIVCQGGTPQTLTVSYANVVSTPTYQWYANTVDNNISGTAIAGAINISYDPPSATLGTIYYYCIVTFPSGACSSITSNTANVIVVAVPEISKQPVISQNLCVGGTVTTSLFANYTGGTGTASYQWFSNTSNSNSGGTLITGATNSSYAPPAFTAVGTYYYYVMITLSGSNCGSVFSNASEIVVFADPVVSIQPLATQSICQGAKPIDLKLTATGGLGLYFYQWYSNIANNTSSGSIITGATSDTYKPSTSSVGTNYYYCNITQANGLGCDAQSEIAEVNILPAPTFTNQPVSSDVCKDGTPTTLSFVIINGSGVPTYKWYSNTVDNTATGIEIPGATSATYDPLTSVVDTTFYYCIVTLPTGTCNTLISDAARVAVNAIPAISTQPTFSQNLCVGGTVATPLNVVYTGGAGTASYQWYSNTINSNIGGTLIAGGTTAGYTPPAFTATGTYYYYVVVTFAGSGCSTLISNPSEIIVVADPTVSLQPLLTQTLCQSSVPADLSVAATGGLGAFSYQWYSNAVDNTTSGTLIPGATSATYKPLTSTPGTNYYYCRFTQATGLGCDATSNTAQVIVVPTPTFATQPTSSIICEGVTPAVLSVSYTGGVGAPAYQWYSNTANDVTSGTAIPGAISASYNPTATTVGTDYYYCVITLSSGGCSSLTSSIAQVTINANPLIAPKNLIICSGETFTVTPDNLTGDIVPVGTTYTWANPTVSYAGSITGASAQSTPQTGISQTLSNASTGLVTVTYTVTPKSGTCTGSDFNVVVTVNPVIIVNTTVDDITCLGANDGTIQVNISGGIPFGTGALYTVSWTGPNGFTSNATSLPALTAGVYNLSITDASGCTVLKSYTIIEPAAIEISTVSKKDINCYGASSGEIAIQITGGTKPYSYAWTKNSLPFANTEDLINLGPDVYEVTVSDINTCALKTATFTITEPQQFIVTGSISHVVNSTVANSGAINLSVTGGSPPYTYNWSTGAKTEDLADIPAGKYIVNVTDTKSCVQMVQFEVFKQTPIVIVVDVKNDYNCLAQEPVKICTAYITGGIPPFQLTWSRGVVSGVNNEIMTTNQNGAVTLTVVDTYGLTASYTFNIATVVGFDYQLINCRDYLSQFNALDAGVAGQNYTYLWDFGDGQNSTLKNVQHKYTNYGTYNVNLTITSALCVSNYQKTITFEPLPKLLLENEIKMCVGDSVLQRVTNAVTHVWSDGSTGDSFLIKEKGDYSVICTSKDGCMDTLRFTVTCDLFNYTIQSDRDELSLDSEPLQLNSEYFEFSKYYWDFGDGSKGEGEKINHTFIAVKEGFFDVKLKVINPNGCSEYATKRIWIVNNSSANTFTPNGDGINDLFMPGWHLKIYNRNGILIYEGNDG